MSVRTGTGQGGLECDAATRCCGRGSEAPAAALPAAAAAAAGGKRGGQWQGRRGQEYQGMNKRVCACNDLKQKPLLVQSMQRFQKRTKIARPPRPPRPRPGVNADRVLTCTAMYCLVPCWNLICTALYRDHFVY